MREQRPAGAAAWWVRVYLWLTRRLYNELAWAYDAVSWLVSLGHWHTWRCRALPHVAGRRVLELGFGTGDLLVELAGHGWCVVGLEPSAAMQRVAARALARRRLTVPRVRARAQHAPFASAGFDALVCTFPAAFILEPATLREAHRVLAPGGRLVIAGLCLETDCAPLRWVGGWLYGRPDGEARAAVTRFFVAHGFRVQVVEDRGRVRAPVLILTKDEGHAVTA